MKIRKIVSVLMTAAILVGMMSVFGLPVSAGPIFYSLFPVQNGEVITEYNKSEHEGIDIVATDLDYVYAGDTGTVVFVADECAHDSWANDHDSDCGHYSTYGNCIMIACDGMLTQLYGHLLHGSLLVKEGDSVKAGQPIARVGASGCTDRKSLHFEMLKNMYEEIGDSMDLELVGYESLNNNIGQKSAPGAVVYSYSGYQESAEPLTVQPLPKSVVVKNGKVAKVTVKETGVDVKLKWYYKDKGSKAFEAASGFTGRTYSVVMTDARAGRQIYCVLTDSLGNTVKSNTVTLDQAVRIKSVAKSNVKAVGKTAKVTVNASGTGLKYTWYYKNKGASTFVKTSSFKSKTYSLAMKDSNAGRQVYCVVTDKYGNSVKSEVVTLDIPVRIKTQPKSVKVAIGKTASVSVKANGSGLKYKWYYKDKGDSKYKLASRKSHTYSVAMSKERAGRQVYCVITDKYGNSVKTKVVTLNKK